MRLDRLHTVLAVTQIKSTSGPYLTLSGVTVPEEAQNRRSNVCRVIHIYIQVSPDHMVSFKYEL